MARRTHATPEAGRKSQRGDDTPSRPSGQDIIESLLDGALLVRRSETLLLRAEAACIAYLSEEPRPKRLGCSSTAVLARERLGIAERTRQ